MALYVAKITCRTVEIDLRHKPAHLIRVSPKATVPVLCLSNGEVIDESIDIMHWALAQHDPLGWLDRAHEPVAQRLLAQTDGPFKQALDQYKYSSRFMDLDPAQARAQAMAALIDPLAEVLSHQPFIGGERASLHDVAIFPFVRQFAGVQLDWFESDVPTTVQAWLSQWVESSLFKTIMQKAPKPA